MLRNIVKKTWIWLSLILTISAGGLFIYLSDIPFGNLFWGSLYAFVIFLLITLLLTGFRLISIAGWQRFSGIFLLLIAGIIFLTSIISIIDFRILVLRKIPGTLSTAEWQEDIDFLAKEFPQRHPDLFSTVSPAAFDGFVQNLNASISNLSEDQIVLQLMKLMALPNDGHTNIFPLPAMNFHFYPLKTFYFEDGWYVTDASRSLQHAIGARIIKIGNTNVEEVFDRYKSIIGAENDYHKRERFAFWGFCAELLAAEGILPDAEHGIFILEGADGKRYSIDASPEPAVNYAYWSFFKKIDNDRLPVLANMRKDNFWYTFDPATKSLYLQINQVVNGSSLDLLNRPQGKTIRQLVAELEQFLENQEVARCIIDLRQNIGGNHFLVYSLADFIRNSPEINQHGKLFTIIGRRTYSAGINFATMLENRTRTLFVGEPGGEGPNQFGDHIRLPLPNSGLTAFISTRYWEGSLKEDNRTWISPDIPVTYTYNDFQENHDPAMTAILNYQPRKRQHISLDDASLSKWSGAYQLSPYQVLKIHLDADRRWFEITDFFDRDLFYVNSDMYPIAENRFATDIAGVALTFISEGKDHQLQLNWKGREKQLSRVPENFVLPLQRIHEGDVDGGAAALTQIYNSGFVFPSNIELKLNTEGYRHLQNENIEAAVKIFRLNTLLFPKSPNTYDSLGEALLASGETLLAIENYAKAFALDPANSHAAAVVEAHQ